jgi:hypothetical protein
VLDVQRERMKINFSSLRSYRIDFRGLAVSKAATVVVSSREADHPTSLLIATNHNKEKV